MLLVDFINVGYGDAILLREYDDGKTFSLLVDCGDMDLGVLSKNSSRIMAVDFLKQQGMACLDILILTHLHKDHVGGILALCQSVKIGEVWTNYLPDSALWNGDIQQDEAWGVDINNLIVALNVYTQGLIQCAKMGTKLRLVNSMAESLYGRVPLKKNLTKMLSIEVTGAEPAFYCRQNEIINFVLQNNKTALCGETVFAAINELNNFINNTSLRLFLVYGDVSLALTADVSAEYWLKDMPGKCTILKAPHHGRQDSLNETVLAQLKPEYVVISVSNDRGDSCPDPDIIRLIGNYTNKCFITDSAAGNSDTQSPPSVHFKITHKEGIIMTTGF